MLWKATSQLAAYLLGQVHAPVCFFSPPPKSRCKYMCVCVCMHISFSVCLCIIMPHEHLTCSLPWNFFKSYSLFHVCKILPIRGATTKMSILSHLSLSFMLRSIQLRVIKLCSHCVRGVEKCSCVCPNVSRRRWCHCYHSCDMCRHLPITHWLCSFCFFDNLMNENWPPVAHRFNSHFLQYWWGWAFWSFLIGYSYLSFANHMSKWLLILLLGA